jgi:dCTP deaminase
MKMARSHRMISPFARKQVSRKVVSFGVSAYGYDFRLADEFQVYTPVRATIIDPKNHIEGDFVEMKSKTVNIPPNSFLLGRSLEYFRIPRDVLAICFGKSTYARCGVIVNVTPLEPEWEGFVTISISNTSPLPVKLYAGEGIAQALFIGADEVCETSYADKKGKYQAQKKITGARIK